MDGPTLSPFIELGLTLNFLNAEGSSTVSSSLLGPMGGVSISESKLLVGFAPGIGLEVRAAPRVGYGFILRYYHVGKDIGNFDELDASFFSGLAFLSFNL